MTRRLMPLFAVALCALSFSSCTCGSQTEEAPPKLATRPAPGGFGSVVTPRRAPEVDVPARGMITPNAIEAHTPPAVIGTPLSQTAIPEDFPEGVPVFDGAKVMAVQQLGNKASNVIFDVDADPPQVFNFYKDKMKGSGWKSTGEYQGKDQSFLSFQKDKTVTNVSVSTDPRTGKKVVSVMYYKEEPLPFPEF
ncbi:MAG: hypothetical protein ABI629_20545 [bacterium]